MQPTEQHLQRNTVARHVIFPRDLGIFYPIRSTLSGEQESRSFFVRSRGSILLVQRDPHHSRRRHHPPRRRRRRRRRRRCRGAASAAGGGYLPERSGGRLESCETGRLGDYETGRLGTGQGGPRVRTVGAREDLGLFAGQK